MYTGKRNRLWTIGIFVTLGVLSVLAVTLGHYTVSIEEIVAVIFPKFSEGVAISDNARRVILNIRIPRVLLALIAGAGLSTAGAAFQALFANPLATPDTLGVATGASFGAALGILLGFKSAGIQFTALAAGILAIILVYYISRVRGTSSVVMIVLSGLVVSAFFSACVSLIKYIADPQDVLPAITFWLMGSMSSITQETVFMGAPFIIAGIAIIYILRWKLNIMTLTDDEARSLGVNVKLIRAIIIIASTTITASVVSMCGLISWVGLLIPHIARMIFGNNNKSVIPACIGLGAIFLLVVDTVARTATGSEIPVSILTSVIGAPVFILLLRQTGGVKA